MCAAPIKIKGNAQDQFSIRANLFILTPGCIVRMEENGPFHKCAAQLPINIEMSQAANLDQVAKKQMRMKLSGHLGRWSMDPIEKGCCSPRQEFSFGLVSIGMSRRRSCRQERISTVQLKFHPQRSFNLVLVLKDVTHCNVSGDLEYLQGCR